MLGPQERLIYEVWVFETGIRNGGVSQFSGNRGIERWERLRAACEAQAMPTLKQFIGEVDQILVAGVDPYAAALHVSPPIEEWYWSVHQAKIVMELRRLVSSNAGGGDAAARPRD